MRTNVTLQPSDGTGIQPPESTRRGFLKLMAGGIGVLALAPDLLKAATLRERYLSFHNPNTGETVRRVYWTPREGYVRESIGEISWALRDYHNNQVKQFDPNVLDQLYAMQLQLGLRQPVHVISAYRSPTTNGVLCERSRGVARNSYHLHAMALDIRRPAIGSGIFVRRPVRWALAEWATIPAPISFTLTAGRCATGAKQTVGGLTKKGRL